MNAAKELFIKLQNLQFLLIRQATGKTEENDPEEYKELREMLTQHPQLCEKLPTFVLSCRNLSDFWSFIQPKFATYAERRSYLHDEFSPLLDSLEFGESTSNNDSFTIIAESGDTFRRQFSAGLPFGLKKPQVKMVSEAGEMRIYFEEDPQIGILREDVYPNLTCQNLQNLVPNLSNSHDRNILRTLINVSSR